MVLCSSSQGRFTIGDTVVTIGSANYHHSKFGDIAIEVTSPTSFVECSGNCEWNFNGSGWVITVLQDIPRLARKGQVFELDRFDAKAAANKKQNDAKNAARIAAAVFGLF